MNDERPIEKLLRRFAKKRRDTTPDASSLEMHPATRRLLQGEVKRQFPGAAGGKAPAPFLKIWWPRLVWALPVLVVLCVGVWALIGPEKKSGVQFDLAKVESVSAPAEMSPGAPALAAAPRDEFKSLDAAAPSAPVAAATPALALGKTTLAYSDARRVEEPVNQPLGTLTKKTEADRSITLSHESLNRQNAAVPTIVPPAATADQELVQKAARARAMLAEVSQTARADKLNTLSVSGGAGPSSAAASAKADNFDKVGALKQNFTQLGLNSRYRNIAKARDASPVLADFEVVQNGNELRVIDSDGSTYAGLWESAAGGKNARFGGDFKEKDSTPQQEFRRAPAASGNAQTGQLYFFRVTGTNRTLNQPVFFAGNFVTLTNGLPAPQAVGGPAGAVQSGREQQALPALFDSIINGRLQLGADKEIEINAVPVNK